MSRALITDILQSSAKLRTQLLGDAGFLELAERAATKLRDVTRSGGVIYTCGNGGSACDAMHFVEELVGRFRRERPGIRAMHFLDPGTVTCWANDVGFEDVFARQAETFCTARDALVLMSTSGKSKNLLAAARTARAKGTFLIALLGKDGGALKDLVDIALIVPTQSTERIQEMHITLIHFFCEMIEQPAS